MEAKRITDEEIAHMKISSLPTRPTSPVAVGGMGLSAGEMKAAFDRLPLFIIERYNRLISDISAIGEESLAGEIKTGICEGHSLYSLFCEIADGRILSRIAYGEGTLARELYEINERLQRLEGGEAENE